MRHRMVAAICQLREKKEQLRGPRLHSMRNRACFRSLWKKDIFPAEQYLKVVAELKKPLKAKFFVRILFSFFHAALHRKPCEQNKNRIKWKDMFSTARHVCCPMRTLTTFNNII